ncbi:MAG: hypothetical protein ACK5KN_16655 [Dysgonomonas sp.]|uniref:hypothetical protein n=1 Tax=Dysgonomonas sp. TaxID=1891233 RepID=UPI003A8C1052
MSRFPNLEDLRKQYAPRQLSVIEVEDKVVVLAPINANAISNYSVALVDPERGMEVATRFLLEDLWLAGDNEIRDDEDYFIAAMLQVQNIVQTKNSSFTKL